MEDDFWVNIIVAIIVFALFWGIGKNGKFDGQTAEEWYYEYDSLVACVEEASTYAESKACI